MAGDFGRVASFQVIASLRADVKHFLSGMGQLQASANKTMDHLVRFGRFAALAVGGIVVAAVKTAIDFETAFAGVQKTVSATDAQFKMLRDGIIDMANQIPASREEIAKVAEVAGQLGIEVDNILEFTRVMIDLGNTTNLSAEQAATAIAKFTNIMGTAAEDVERIGSVLVDLGNNFATTEADILSMAENMAGMARVAGFSEPQVLAWATAMSSVGVEAQLGGTAFQKTVQDISSAVSSGGAKLDLFAKTAGMSTAEFSRLFREDASSAMAAFVTGLDGVRASGQDVNSLLTELGITEARQTRVLLSVAGASDTLKDALGKSNSAWGQNSALVEEAEKRYGTTASMLKVLWNNISSLLLVLGDALLPVLKAMTKWITENQELFKGLAIVVGSILVGAAAAFVVAFIAANALVLGIGAAIGGVIALLVLAWNKSETFRDIVIGSFTAVKDFVVGVWEFIRDSAVDVWDKIKKPVMEFWEGILKIAGIVKDFVIDVFRRIKESFGKDNEGLKTSLGDFVKHAGDALKSLFEFLSKVAHVLAPILKFVAPILARIVAALFKLHFKTLFATFKAAFTIIKGVFKILGGLLEFVVNIFQGKWKKAFKGLGTAVSGVWDVIRAPIELTLSILKNLLGFLSDVLGPVWDKIWGAMKVAFTATWGAIKAVAMSVWSYLKNIWNTIWPPMAAVFKVAWETIKAIFTGIWTVIRIQLSVALAAIMTFWEFVWTGIKTIFGVVWNAIKAIFEPIWNPLVAAIQAGLEFLSGIWNTVWNAVKAVWEVVWGAILAVGTAIWDAISSSFTTVFNFLRDVWTAIWDSAKNVFSTIWDTIFAIGTRIWESIKNVFEPFINFLKDVWTRVWESIKNVFSEIWDKITGAVQKGVDVVKDIFQNAVDIIKKIWGGIVDAFKGPINSVIRMINRFSDKVSGVAGKLGLDFDFHVSEIKHDGGIIGQNSRSIRGDERLALLQTGEGVLSRQAMKSIGSVFQSNQSLFVNQTGSPSSGIRTGPVAVTINVYNGDGVQAGRDAARAFKEEIMAGVA